jgi:hypothetical protein
MPHERPPALLITIPTLNPYLGRGYSLRLSLGVPALPVFAFCVPKRARLRTSQKTSDYGPAHPRTVIPVDKRIKIIALGRFPSALRRALREPLACALSFQQFDTTRGSSHLEPFPSYKTLFPHLLDYTVPHPVSTAPYALRTWELFSCVLTDCTAFRALCPGQDSYFGFNLFDFHLLFTYC